MRFMLLWKLLKIQDLTWKKKTHRVGVIVSSGIGGLQELEDQIIRMHERGMKRIKPMFIPKALSNMGAGNIALKIGAQGYVNQ